MSKRSLTYAAALVSAFVLAGCGAGADGDTSSSPSRESTASRMGGNARTPTVEPVTPEQISDDAWWKSSLCSKLDLGRLSRDSGISGLKRQLGNGFNVDVPPMRTCEVGQDTRTAIGKTFGVGISTTTISKQEWQQVKQHAKKVLDDPATMKSIDVGEDAFATPSLAKALVGSRVVTIDTRSNGKLNPRQLKASLEDAVEASKGFPTTKAPQVIPACAKADRQAADLLGTKPTIRLDFYHPAFKVPNCLWATETTGIRVFAISTDDAASQQQDAGYDRKVKLGRGGGLYLDDGSVKILSWASQDNRHDVNIEFVEGQRVKPADAIALGKSLQGLY